MPYDTLEISNNNISILNYDLIYICSALCLLSYKEKKNMEEIEEKLKEFDVKLLKIIDRKSSEAFIFENKDYYFLIFTGTELNEINDILADLKFDFVKTKEGRIHRGIYKYYSLLSFSILKYMLKLLKENRKPVVIGGHSLGGAMAVLAAIEISKIADCYVVTFGQPKLGDLRFAEYYEQKLNYIRIVIDRDMIPKLPPSLFGYCHFGFKMILDTREDLMNKHFHNCVVNLKNDFLNLMMFFLFNLKYFMKNLFFDKFLFLKNHKMSSYHYFIKKMQNLFLVIRKSDLE
jgi:hypothetical protein